MKDIVLFDMDGTLTEPRKLVSSKMVKKLKELARYSDIGIVTGSGYDYLVQQCQDIWYEIDSVPSSSITLLPCNGTQVYIPDTTGRFAVSHKVDMRKELGDEVLDTVMTCLTHIQFLHTYSKPPHSLTGHFISYRDSMINWCPVGRNANNEQREEFIKFDIATGTRLLAKDMIQKYLSLYGIENVVLALGGSTSIDIFPKGWDKTYALQHFHGKDCWFVGDSCGSNGNDRSIYEKIKQDGRGFITSGPEKTLGIISEIIGKINKKDESR
jgi:phosphomannomutase